MNSICEYPSNANNCQKCVENATLVGEICQCNEGYYGIGYTYCSKENGNIFNIFHFRFFFFL